MKTLLQPPLNKMFWLAEVDWFGGKSRKLMVAVDLVLLASKLRDSRGVWKEALVTKMTSSRKGFFWWKLVLLASELRDSRGIWE